MEQNFQTSFIPKKPIIDEKAFSPKPVGVLTVISIFIFFTVVLVTGAMFFYKGTLAKNITQMEANLNLAKNRFEPSKILELQVLDKRLRASDEVLGRHMIVTPIFEILQKITMKSVSYISFGYFADTDGKVNIKMEGMAQGYRAVALQSDLFSKNENILSPVFSNLSLDEKGNVLFDLEFSVLPELMNYKKSLEVESGFPTGTYSGEEESLN